MTGHKFLFFWELGTVYSFAFCGSANTDKELENKTFVRI